MKKLITILLFSIFSANAECLYGIGLEGSFIKSGSNTENQLGQIQRSFQTLAVGVKCGKMTFSTTDLPINKGYTVRTHQGDLKVELKRWTVGYQLFEFNTGDFQLGLGASVSRIMQHTDLEDNKYTQTHLVVGVMHKSGVAVFNSIGKKDGNMTGTVGVYYVF